MKEEADESWGLAFPGFDVTMVFEADDIWSSIQAACVLDEEACSTQYLPVTEVRVDGSGFDDELATNMSAQFDLSTAWSSGRTYADGVLINATMSEGRFLTFSASSGRVKFPSVGASAGGGHDFITCDAREEEGLCVVYATANQAEFDRYWDGCIYGPIAGRTCSGGALTCYHRGDVETTYSETYTYDRSTAEHNAACTGTTGSLSPPTDGPF